MRRYVFHDGRTLVELNAATGTYRIEDMSGAILGYTHAERVEYAPTLAEQYVMSRLPA